MEKVTLPSTLERLCELSFGICAIKEIVIPDGVTFIDDWAFSECPNLEKVTIPAGVEFIGTLAFDEHAENFTIYGECGSYAQQYAAENELDFVASEDSHDWGEWTEVKGATETETGLEERTCSVCGEKQTRDIPVLQVTPSEPTETEPPVSSDEDENVNTGNYPAVGLIVLLGTAAAVAVGSRKRK